MYCETMIESTAANMARHFTEFLAKVERGETIRIRDRGRMVARMVPDCDFMPGQQAAELFKEIEQVLCLAPSPPVETFSPS